MRCPNQRENIVPYNITEAATCFTVGTRQSTWNGFVHVHQTNKCPLVWNNVKDDSSDYRHETELVIVRIDLNRAPSVPNSSTLSITPKRSSSHDV
ncbi:hypothetical protein TNCV_4139681 [Trichonephila clavipes]|nr:hypothetical protein TNCV_4139681 [Trichonephila clavipes]